MASPARWSQLLCLGGAVAALGALGPKQGTAPRKEGYPNAACFPGIPDVERLRQLRFDPVFGAADTQFVDFLNGSLNTGDKKGWIEPQSEAWSPDLSKQLASKKRCVIARIGTEQDVPGPPFFGARRVYWLVQGDPASDTGTSMFIPESETIRQRHTVKVIFDKHPRVSGHPGWRQSIARFRSGTVSGWGVCGDMCCKGALQ